MVTRDEMQELVDAHAALDDPLETAIWIRSHDREAWLVEIISNMGADAHPERPVEFNAGISFRHGLNLFIGNRESIERALQADAQLARDVANGVILHGERAGSDLQRLAAKAADAHSRAG